MPGVIDEASVASANLAGLRMLTSDQIVSFQLYVRWVLPLDGYVFWLGTGDTLPIRGSLHVGADKRQNEDETLAISRVVFTTGDFIQKFNEIAPDKMWVGQVANIRFAFSRSGIRFKLAGLYHYEGYAVYPALENMLVPVGNQIPSSVLIASDSLPMWLTLKTYSPVWSNPPNPGITLFPSYAVPDNIGPPYGSVHIFPESIESLQVAPSFGPSSPTGWAALGTVFGSTPASTHYQLVTERVRVTLYGTTNQQALDFMDLVNRYSYDQDMMGIMALTPMRDEKRTQAELGLLAMKKTIEYRVSYYQTRANAVARQLIEAAQVSAYQFTNPI